MASNGSTFPADVPTPPISPRSVSIGSPSDPITGPELKEMDTPMESSLFGPLLLSTDGSQHRDVQVFLNKVLQAIDQEGAYGIYAMYAGSPSFIIGVPNPAGVPTTLKEELKSLAAVLIEDHIQLSGMPKLWCYQPVKYSERPCVEGISLGLKGSLNEAGSFGGYVRWRDGHVGGLTAAHCLPNANVGDTVVSPSCAEITARVENISPYTSRSLSSRHRNAGKEDELNGLLQRFGTESSGEGVPLRDGETVQEVMFLGDEFGTINHWIFERRIGLLSGHDKELLANGIRTFDADPEWVSQLDCSTFEVLERRRGTNSFEGLPVMGGPSLLSPGCSVIKVGRTSGTRNGIVNGTYLQHWANGQSTWEIAVIAEEAMGLGFAEKGDSGALAMIQKDENLFAAGVIIGKNHRSDVVLLTPLNSIMRAIGDAIWLENLEIEKKSEEEPRPGV